MMVISRIFFLAALLVCACISFSCIPYGIHATALHPETSIDLRVVSADDSEPLPDVGVSITSEWHQLQDLEISPTGAYGRTTVVLPPIIYGYSPLVWHLLGFIPLFSTGGTEVSCLLMLEKEEYQKKMVDYPNDFKSANGSRFLEKDVIMKK